MLFYVIFLLVCVSVCYAGDPQKMAACAQELSVTNLDEIFSSFKTTGQIQNENDKNAKCLFFCLAKKENSSDNAGNIDVSAMNAMIAPLYASKMSADEVKTLLDKCAVRNESDPCDKLYMFHKCHMKEFLGKA